MKYIVIDGKKFKTDSNDESKALLDSEGNPIPYEEESPTPPKEGDRKSIEELAKTNPEIARLLKERKELEEEKAERERKSEEERQEALRKNGEYQKLSEENSEKALGYKKKLDEVNALLDKYKGTVNEIRDEMLAQIPEEKKPLIPEDSAKNQIDYIRRNAKFLGVSLIATHKGGEVPPNEDTPPLDEEGKLTKEFSELMKKENLTRTEDNRLLEVSKLLKQIRSRKQ